MGFPDVSYFPPVKNITTHEIYARGGGLVEVSKLVCTPNSIQTLMAPGEEKPIEIDR